MPVCLKCGAEIPRGDKYCDSCGPEAAQQVAELLAMGYGKNYQSYRRSGGRWFVFSLVFILFLMVGIGAILIYSIPTGPELAKTQAAVCRASMRRVRDATTEYWGVTSKFPPTGRVASGSPLVQDQYIETAPECPVTHHYYILENENGQPVVKCDSGKPGHSI
jgi:hypothetical protein